MYFWNIQTSVKQGWAKKQKTVQETCINYFQTSSPNEFVRSNISTSSFTNLGLEILKSRVVCEKGKTLLTKTWILDWLPKILRRNEVLVLISSVDINCTILHHTKYADRHIALVALEPKGGAIKMDHHSNYLGGKWAGPGVNKGNRARRPFWRGSNFHIAKPF